MVSSTDLHWAAGFLEGEGSFVFTSSPRAQANQVQREPLERLQKILGGKIYFPKSLREPRRENESPKYMWVADSGYGIGIMMTMYSLMSPRRKEQIKSVIAEWKSRKPWFKYRTHCAQGHSYTERGVYVSNGHRKCKECVRLMQIDRRARQKAELNG